VNIAICDDDKKVCDEIERYLDNYMLAAEFKYNVDVYYSAEELLDHIDDYAYDVIFLDIYMDGMDGIKAGHLLRENINNITTEIIFISTSENHYKEALKVRAFDFLDKPIDKESFIQVLKKLMEFYQNNINVFFYPKGRTHNSVRYNDIYYFEVNNRVVTIISDDQKMSFYSSMKDLVSNIKSDAFICPHNSYLINRNYIKQITYEEIIMVNGEKIPISQKKRKDIRKKLLSINIKNSDNRESK